MHRDVVDWVEARREQLGARVEYREHSDWEAERGVDREPTDWFGDGGMVGERADGESSERGVGGAVHGGGEGVGVRDHDDAGHRTVGGVRTGDGPDDHVPSGGEPEGRGFAVCGGACVDVRVGGDVKGGEFGECGEDRDGWADGVAADRSGGIGGGEGWARGEWDVLESGLEVSSFSDDAERHERVSAIECVEASGD